MIDQTAKITDTKDLKTLQRILDSVHTQSTGTTFGNSTAVSVAMVTPGKLHVADDGTTIRLYFRTGKNNVGYITMGKV